MNGIYLYFVNKHLVGRYWDFKTLTTSNASGPDGINSRVLIEADHRLEPHLSKLFNFSVPVLFLFHGKYPVCGFTSYQSGMKP